MGEYPLSGSDFLEKDVSPMGAEQVQCPRCGWQNSTGDRMCGGCGQPLFHPGSALGAPPDYTPTVASSSVVAPPPLPPDTRTATWRPPAFPPQLATGAPTAAASTARPAPKYHPATPARATSRSCLSRALITLAIVALMLLLMSACGWAAVIRPAVHASVDQQLRAGLAAQIDKIPPIPDGFPAITRTITDTEFNRQASGGNATNNQGDMKDIVVRFSPGLVTMSYRLWGSPGKIETHLFARNGRIFVTNTQVNGWLAQVETGDELQGALNDSLARLPGQDYVERLVVGNGTLTITLRHA